MSEPIIIAENLSKKYLIRHQTDADRYFRHAVARVAKTPWRWMRQQFRSNGGKADGGREEFWALRDVSFEIQRGEAVGIIGRNGAGKSTLLKILSRITEPTSGRARLRGRVASLLEVGTGFHPELTGRENIYLNGSILGMRKAEIARKFDEIVAFADIEKFLDTPVKRYSSGMYVRLAFAVAAHLEPEILVVDEVLAVGDLRFQQKCLGKMREVARQEGRTVLFVSHNLGAINSLTNKTIYLKEGGMAKFARTADVVASYLGDSLQTGCEWTAKAISPHPLQIMRVALLSPEGRATSHCEAEEGFIIDLTYEVRKEIFGALVEVYIYSSDGIHLLTLGEHDANPDCLLKRIPGRYRTQVRVPGGWLNVGAYYIHVNSGTTDMTTYDYAQTFSFEVVEHHRHTARHGRGGYMVPLIPWQQVERGDLI